MAETERGTTLSALADKIRGENSDSRFSRLAKFLLFLYDNDRLADSRHVKLAEALRPEHVWSPSFMLTPLWDQLLIPERRTNRYVLEISFVAVALISLGFAAIEKSVSTWVFSSGPMTSSFELWLAIVVAFSLGRTLRSLGEFTIGRSNGRRPSLRLNVDLLSLSLGSGTTASGANVFGFVASVVGIGLCATAGAFDSGNGLLAFAALLATFAEANPFAKSAMTDALKSLYASFEESRFPQAEAVIRKLHVGICVVWCLVLGVFAVMALPAVTDSWRSSFVATSSLGQLALLVGAAKLVGIFVGWIADIVSSFSYSEANERSIRRLWRRRPVRLAAFGGNATTKVDLEALPLLRQIDSDTRRRLLENAKVLEIEEGHAAVRQGEVERVLYVILEGRMAVAKRFKKGRGKSRRKVVALLESGAVFGEAAFFFGHARTADVVAIEPTKVLAITHDSTMKTLDTSRGAELQTRIWFLQALVSGSFLQEIPTEALDAVIHSGKVLRVPAGNRVIQEGEAAEACYFIVQGRATVMQNLKVINELGAGDAFGEIALLSQGILRTASVHADTELLLIMIDGANFWNLLRSHLPFALEVERLSRARLASDRARQQSKSF